MATEEIIDLDSIKEKIRKIQATIEGGTEESENAKLMLAKLLKKHNITLEQVYEENKTERQYRCYTDYEKKLFVQCIKKYCGKKRIIQCLVRDTRVFVVDMTKVEFIDIQEAMAFHKMNLKKEFRKMFTAYLCSHDLFDRREYEEDKDENVDSSMTMEEILELTNLMKGMGKDRLTKKLKNGQKLLGE